MAITLNGTTGITAPDIDVTAQSTDIVTTGDVSAVDGTFSGGVYLGGTGSANYFDDYEEGTWTPTFGGATTDPTVTYTDQIGSYVKIGTFVHVAFELLPASFSGGSGNLQIEGLPFSSNARAHGTVSYERFNLDGRTQSILSINENGSVIIPLEMGDNVDVSGIDISTFVGNRKCRGSISYMTDS